MSLANWQTATGNDASSISADPQFTSTTNLHISRIVPDTLSPVENIVGATIGAIATDFDGDTRGNPPDIGADEVTTMQFSTAAYSVAESVGSGLATITVTRTAGSGNRRGDD